MCKRGVVGVGGVWFSPSQVFSLPGRDGYEMVMPQNTYPKQVIRQAADEGNLHTTHLVNLVFKLGKIC